MSSPRPFTRTLFCVVEGMCTVQGSAKEWALGCVKRAPAAKGGQDAGITQPRGALFSRSLYCVYALALSYFLTDVVEGKKGSPSHDIMQLRV